MAEQTLTRRAESKRTTAKISPLPPPRLNRFPAWLSGPALVLLIAVGGAVIGSLGSQLVARLSGPQRGRVAKSSLATDRLVEIDNAMQVRDFSTALILADEALRSFPGDPQFSAKRKRAEDELQNRFRYQTFQLAVSRQNYQAALALFDEMPADSAYKFKATQELKAVREQYIAEQLQLAQSAARLQQCEETRAFATAVLSLDNTNRAALDLVGDCAARKAEGSR